MGDKRRGVNFNCWPAFREGKQLVDRDHLVKVTDKMHKYKVLDKLGEGAQGVVHKAILLDDDKSKSESKQDDSKEPFYVAMKRMKISDEQTGVSNETIREIMCLREIKHENIINVCIPPSFLLIPPSISLRKRFHFSPISFRFFDSNILAQTITTKHSLNP